MYTMLCYLQQFFSFFSLRFVFYYIFGKKKLIVSQKLLYIQNNNDICSFSIYFCAPFKYKEKATLNYASTVTKL